MDAVIKMPSSEFNEEVFKKIKALITSFGNADVTIAISNNKDFRSETKDEYWDRLNRSVKDLENGNGVTFTMEELGEYIHKTSL